MRLLYTETLANRTTNIIRWGPKGRHVVLATLGSSTKSDIEFWDLDFHTDDFGGRVAVPGKEPEWAAGMQNLSTIDHYGVTDIEWDPSGRFVATSVSSWRHTVGFVSPKIKD
jgi:translation initiation factor 3 subunit B